MSEEVQQIKDKIDVAELVGEYVQLKPAGVNKKGLCPFHHEKTPSFMVSPERQSWHCFGCGKGGDIFSFIEEIEGMEFKEALKYLANRAGVVLTSNFRSEINSSQKNRIKELNNEAARFFHSFLLRMSASKPAMDYLINRGLKMETIEEWKIGFIPEQWVLLTQYLLKKGFSIDDLVASGLTIKRDNADPNTLRGFYDRFRGRIMFPIWDIQGEVVGFTGRILVEKENSGGKYVNTPQTIVYDKSHVIFGLNKAKQEIKSKNLIVMVEGQMDTIACHQAGMKNVVASSGTALTEEQVHLLKRYSNNLNMAFDMDEAGQNAARRGIAVALKDGFGVKVIRLPKDAGKDPDECLKKHPQIWFDAVEKAQEVMEWYFEKAFINRDLNNHKNKQVIANELLPEIALIQYAVERDHWLKELGSQLSVEVSVLREDMERIKNLKSKAQNFNSGESLPSKQENKTKLAVLLEAFLALVLKFPDLLIGFVDEDLIRLLSMSESASLYEAIKKLYNEDKKLNIEKLIPGVNFDNQEKVNILLLQGEWQFSGLTQNEAETEMGKLVASIKEECNREKRKHLQIEIEKAEKAGEKEKVQELLQELIK